MPRRGMAFFFYSESSVIVRLPAEHACSSFFANRNTSATWRGLKSFMIIFGYPMFSRLTAVLLLIGCLVANPWAQNSPQQTPSPNATEATAESPLDHFQNFSAIQTGGPLPGMTEERYIYRSGNLMRMQGDADLPEYFVTDLAKQETHSVSSRGCLESASAYKLSFPFFVTGPNITYERIPISEESVDGHSCHVEDLIIHNPKNPVVVHFRLSEADDLQGFPIKIENRRDHAYPWVIHYKDVRIGPQDPTLFIFPDKCQTMAGMKKMGSASKAKTGATPKTK